MTARDCKGILLLTIRNPTIAAGAVVLTLEQIPANCKGITTSNLQSELVHRMLPADVMRGHDVHEMSVTKRLATVQG